MSYKSPPPLSPGFRTVGQLVSMNWALCICSSSCFCIPGKWAALLLDVLLLMFLPNVLLCCCRVCEVCRFVRAGSVQAGKLWHCGKRPSMILGTSKKKKKEFRYSFKCCSVLFGLLVQHT